MKDTVESFTEIVSGKGELVYSTGADDLVDKIGQILKQEKGKSLDLVLCLDATGSMKNDIDSVRRLLIPLLEDMIAEFVDFRIGMVLYKDYYDEYLTQIKPFTRDFEVFRRTLNAIRPSGGRDIPEAVYEALNEAVIKFPWEAESKLIILIGDAPPHPRQRGKVSKEMVNEGMEKRGLKVHAIILPQ
jgi:Mg-chelatase subunit ChlD